MLRHFTRVLHRTVDDELSAVVPTVRVDPRRPDCDRGCDFVVGDRADAFVKFSKRPEFNLCLHVLIAETDYLFFDKIPRESLPENNTFVGYSYGYINPSWPDHVALAHRYYPSDLNLVPSSGPAPGLLTGRTFRKLAPMWADIQNAMDADPDVVKTYGWVRDMYSFSFALARRKIRAFIPSVPFNQLMVQIPADDQIGQAVCIHYSWGAVISINETKVWSFDKRTYDAQTMQPIPLLPMWTHEMRLQAGEKVSLGVYRVIQLFVAKFNEALLALSESSHL